MVTLCHACRRCQTSLAIRGDHAVVARMKMAALDQIKLVTSPMTVIEAYDRRVPKQRLEWVLSRVEVPHIDVAQAREAIALLESAGLGTNTRSTRCWRRWRSGRPVGG